MPEPYKFYGKDYVWGSDELVDQFNRLVGPDFVQEIEDYKTGKAKVGPRSSWDYKMKRERHGDSAKRVQEYLDKLYSEWEVDAGGQAPPAPSPTPNIFERDPLLKKLLEQRR